MARTFKDQPDKVKALKAMRAGKIDHEHHRLGQAERTIVASYSQEADALHKAFYKYQTKEIRAYREFLDSMAERFTYEVTELPTIPSFSRYGARGEIIVEPTTPKRVVFEVWAYRVLRATTAYCTDAAHYDVENKLDTRDGKWAVCTPDVPYRSCRCAYCGAKKRAMAPATKERAHLSKLSKLYNSGTPAALCDDELPTPYSSLPRAAMC